MNIIIYLIVAAVIGWVATEIMHDRSNLLINIVVAVIGAFLAGYFLTPLLHPAGPLGPMLPGRLTWRLFSDLS